MKLSLVSLAILLSFVIVTGCTRKPAQESLSKAISESEAPLPEITSESEEGFHDLVFAIREHKQLSDGRQMILAAGIHKGTRVSFEIYLDSGWRESPLDKDVPLITYLGHVSFHSVGAESDVFLHAMDEIYGTSQSPKQMNQATEFTALSLGGDPRDLSKEIVKIKMFFDSDAEDQYAEFFTNIDLNARKLYISEKDEEYRTAIIRALKKS